MAFSSPLRISTGLAPWATLSIPLCAMARARTVAVVVPSPASSLVLLATSWTSLAPTFWNLSWSSTALATVTPSLVILGPPQEDSMTTFLPLGPMVTLTASAKTFTPAIISSLTVRPNLTSLAYPLLLRVLRVEIEVRDSRARLNILYGVVLVENTRGNEMSLVEVNQAIL